MRSNAIFFGWNRWIPGREPVSAQHFQTFSEYLGRLQQSGDIASFEAVFLDPHGGDLNGFFLIRGDAGKLDALMSSNDWITHMTRALLHLEGSGAIRAATGPSIQARMEVWTKLFPT